MLNFNQLRCFWATAKAGNLQRAAERLHLTPQTLSGQIGRLEDTLGVALFERSGRRLVLTDSGRLAFGYAEEIFQAGAELEDVLRRRPGQAPLLFRVGITDALPKAVAYHLLAPAMALPAPVRLVCREGPPERLLAELAVNQLDLVLADAPVPAGLEVKGRSHRLGACGIAFLATPALADSLVGPFPACLHDAPCLLPSELSATRAPVLHWLQQQGIRPRPVGEFDDGALMKAFGQAGVGVFPVPALVAEAVCRQYGVVELGRTQAVEESFYAISVGRGRTHPAVQAIIEAARTTLFAPAPTAPHTTR